MIGLIHRSICRYISVVCVILMITSISCVFANWNYLGNAEDIENSMSLQLGYFDYSVENVPIGEVTLIERLYAILNNMYSTDLVTDSRDYLINETIQVEWEPGAPPYVGSMDLDYAFQINELFGDVIHDEHVSFILKNQDLNWDGYNEISPPFLLLD